MRLFLYVDICIAIEVLMKRFIKKDVMAETETAKQLSQIYVSSKKVHPEPLDVDMDVATIALSFVPG